ncbi:MAG: DUF4363 family protein [Eubacterium sp.]|nr:DUF4363 family protein [Eubacterium sp.]
MKRLWFAAVFLAIALCACSYEQYVVKCTYNEINEVIDKALATDNSDEKIKYCNEITDKWDNYFRKVTLVTDHSIVQSADVSFGTLSALAEEESESIDETLIESKSELKQIYDSSRINLSNIF